MSAPIASRLGPPCALALIATLALGARPAPALPPIGDGDGGFRLTQIGTFDEPTQIVDAPGKKNRKLLFVVEQGGRVIVVRGGVPRTFLDISDRVLNAGEQGMLSAAFHPRYEKNRRFYVYFTDTRGDNEVVEFKRSKRSRVRANAASGRVVLDLPHPTFGNHNGGQLQFGPKRLLYIGPGDGGAGGDPPNNAQNPKSLLGKILRIDPLPQRKRKKRKRKKGSARAAAAVKPYGVPRGNPFVGAPGRDEVFSLGLRNPYRFTFDAVGGAIAIGDVGQGCREEIDYRRPGGARGANFGWSAFEGTHEFNASRFAPGAIFPILEYDNANAGAACPPLGGFSGSSVIVGYVVRDQRLAHQYGRLLYADFSSDQIRSLIPSELGAADDQASGVSIPAGQPDSFGQTRGNVLWVVSHAGPVYRLDP